MLSVSPSVDRPSHEQEKGRISEKEDIGGKKNASPPKERGDWPRADFALSAQMPFLQLVSDAGRCFVPKLKDIQPQTGSGLLQRIHLLCELP